jgi:hypothetical protein
LQVSANKRAGRGLVFGLAYTWARTLGLTNGDGDFPNPFNAFQADYGPLSFDIPHNLVFNWVYDVPKVAAGGNFLDNPVGRAIFNNWQVSGIFNRQSGVPAGVGFSIDGVGNLNERYTGSPNVGPRVFIVGNPNNGPKNEYAYIDTSVFRPPIVKGSAGLEHGKNPLRFPSWYNVDASIFKNFPMFREGTYLQLRMEMFNAFNNVQFNGMNTNMVFSRTTGQVINVPTVLGGNGGRFGFGSLTGTRDPRVIQLAAKFYF